jgi:hypothetical protein
MTTWEKRKKLKREIDVLKYESHEEGGIFLKWNQKW